MQNILHHTKSYYFAIIWIKLDTLFLTNVCMYSWMYLVQNTAKFNSDTVCTYSKCKHFIELLTLTHCKIQFNSCMYLLKLQTFHWTTYIKTLQNTVTACTHCTIGQLTNTHSLQFKSCMHHALTPWNFSFEPSRPQFWDQPGCLATWQLWRIVSNFSS